MKRIVVELLLSATVVLPASFLRADSSQNRNLQQRHWEQTQTETIWRDRYTNCDYGYYVLLPAGVIAHGSHSPSPNHGFLVPLPDVARTSYASINEERFVWVNANYNVSDYHSLAGVANYELDLMKAGESAFRVVERKSAKLAGLRAIYVRVVYETPKGRVVEQKVIALRSGIVYTIGLRTREAEYRPDDEQFREICKGLKLLRLPRGACTNG
jgi:hypothetical protein